MTNVTKKKLHIKTWGCQMNVYDSERMVDTLAPLGYQQTSEVEDADMVIFNTCHIREKAAEKIYSELGRLRSQKEQMAEKGKRMIIAIAGCVAQAEGQEIIRRAPYVDIVLGTQTYHGLPEMIAKISRAAGEKLVNTDFPTETRFDNLPAEIGQRGVSAFLAIQEGCDNFCTYCVVPYTRGAEFSRPAFQIMDEAEKLVASGVKEITLIGQNVNAWRGADRDGKTWTLGRLIREMAEISGLQRIRYTTSHPMDMAADLIDVHGSLPKLMPFLHLPIQSGSDRILKLMNRRHKVADYLAVIEKLHKSRPDLALSSDFIVGFPGETDKDFEATLEVVRQVGYAQAYSFKYSPRPGTVAAGMKGQLPENVKEERLAALQELLTSQQKAFNEATVGKVVSVLFDRDGKIKGQSQGKSPYMQTVNIIAPEKVKGQIVEIKIVSATASSLSGEIAQIE